MSGIRPPIIVAGGRDVTPFGPAAEAGPYAEPADVTEAAFRSFDAEGRSLRIEIDGSRVSIGAAENRPANAGELEELLRGFLERVAEPAEAGRDLPRLVAACDRCKVDTSLSLRAALLGFFHNLWRSLLGRELRRRGR